MKNLFFLVATLSTCTLTSTAIVEVGKFEGHARHKDENDKVVADYTRMSGLALEDISGTLGAIRNIMDTGVTHGKYAGKITNTFSTKPMTADDACKMAVGHDFVFDPILGCKQK